MRGRLRRRLWVITATLLTASGLVALNGAQASAAYDCPSNHVCFYEYYKLTGSVFDPNGSVKGADMAHWPYSGVSNFAYYRFANGNWLDNEVSSIDNQTGWCVLVYREPSYNGAAFVAPPHWRGNLPSKTGWDDQISSAQYLWGGHWIPNPGFWCP